MIAPELPDAGVGLSSYWLPLRSQGDFHTRVDANPSSLAPCSGNRRAGPSHPAPLSTCVI